MTSELIERLAGILICTAILTAYLFAGWSALAGAFPVPGREVRSPRLGRVILTLSCLSLAIVLGVVFAADAFR
jgi:hypothetical protein